MKERIFRKRFDKNCPQWDPTKSVNKTFLNTEKWYFNTLLRNRGFVLLQDAYDSLGLEITKESCVYGWHSKVSEKIKFDFYRTHGASEFDLVFTCYPILDYLKRET